jgi:hypothetical protein
MIMIISSAAWKGYLARVRTHPSRSLHEHDLWTARTITDQDQHGGGSSTDSWPNGDHPVQPRLLR